MSIKYSPSRQKKFNLCKRWYYLNYVQGWRETVKAPWLIWGTQIDELLGIYDTEGLDKCLDSIKDYFSDPYDTINVKHLLMHYGRKYDSLKLSPIDFLGQKGNQFKFDTSLRPNHLNYSLQITGYIDKVIEHEKKLAFVERKTTSQSITLTQFSEYWKGIKSDKQIIEYSYALSELFQEEVNKCFYEVLRKPTKSINKCFDKEKIAIEDYEEGVAKYFEEPKKDMFIRKAFWITQEMRDEWLMDLIADDKIHTAMELEQKELECNGWNGQYAWPRNQFSCGAFGGCPFFEYCEGNAELKQMSNIYQKGR